MVTINKNICKECGICISFFNGYCMNSDSGLPVIDYKICNQCQKCIAICPHQAILMNDKPPVKKTNLTKIGYDELISLLRFRRSTKKFTDKSIPKNIITDIARSAKYAPNQNKNIDILIMDDPSIIHLIDSYALKYINLLYKIMFSIKIITMFIAIFSKSINVIKKKMERDLYFNKHIVKENTNVLILAIGDPKVPTTEMSAQYLLSTMILTAESLDVGCTLMDSLKMTINSKRIIKNKLGIKNKNKVLGVLALGYSNEKIKNIPDGYKINIYWNRLL